MPSLFLGKRFLSRVAPRVLKIVTALLFIGIGLVMLLLVALGRV